jgi:uncharacterized repeat protein (TIGR03803 family)
MRAHILRIALAAAVLITGTLSATSRHTEVLHTFADANDGSGPMAGLVSDQAGNLYGTTEAGGLGYGTVFELSPCTGNEKCRNGYFYRLLYSFTAEPDGKRPLAGLILDQAGNLYGTTAYGGTGARGTVFKLSPSQGSWQESVIYSFRGFDDGMGPLAGLVFDDAGNLYGTTVAGGTGGCNGGFGCGTVFELSPNQSGGWDERVLYAFPGGASGWSPIAEVILDAAGNIYGTTYNSNSLCCGVVFELSRDGNGWSQTVLYAFQEGADAQYPRAGLVMDSAGNLYGATSFGGFNTYGAVFELSRSGNGWQEKVLHSFNSVDGREPEASLRFDAAGNLYGTTQFGGARKSCLGQGCGTIFELSPDGAGGWTERVIKRFLGKMDGLFPVGGVILDATGNVYTTTVTTAIKLTPRTP